MLRELSIDGVLVSSLLPYFVGTIPVFWLVDNLLQRFGWYRLVWHPALVRLALFVILFNLLFSYGRLE
jgi:protein AaeX